MRCSAAHRSAARRPLYSATLFVQLPRNSFSSTIVPSACSIRTPYPAGPGLPREPPSMLAAAEPPRLSPNRDCWFTAARNLTMDDRVFNRRRRGDPVQHPLTAFALDDGVVVTDLLENGRSQADVT